MLKLKRTFALKMVVLAPLAIICLTVFMASQAPFSVLRMRAAEDDWRALSKVNFQFWALLMMPLYITLQTALIAGLDHSEHHWKALLARPVPRWAIYLAKLLIVVAMAIASGVVLLCGLLAGGAFLHQSTAELRFGFPVPYASMGKQLAEITGMAFLSLTIQHWVSLRWSSFPAAIGFGIVAMVAGFAMAFAGGQFGGWPQYFPWSLPMLPLARQPHDIGTVLWAGATAGLVVSVAGCIDFCRREVS